jgi:hypothetical protein
LFQGVIIFNATNYFLTGWLQKIMISAYQQIFAKFHKYVRVYLYLQQRNKCTKKMVVYYFLSLTQKHNNNSYLYRKARKCHFASASTVCGAEASAENVREKSGSS